MRLAIRLGTAGTAGAARRRPVRLRLTLVYSGLFLAAGAVLLAVTYGLVAQSLSTTPPTADTGPQASQYLTQALQLCKERGLDPIAMSKCEQTAEGCLPDRS